MAGSSFATASRARLAALGACAAAACWTFPAGYFRIDQWHGLLLASMWTCLWLRPSTRVWPWRLAGAWAIVVTLAYRDAYGIAWLFGATAWLLSEAGARLAAWPIEVRRAVRWIGVAQLCYLAAAWLGHPWANQAGSGWAGSLGKRHALAAWWSLCAMWTPGRWGWAWIIGAVCSGSWVGWPVVAWRRLSSRWRVIAGLIGLMLAVWWWPQVAQRVGSRWHVWSQIPWGAPVGFAALPGGFAPVGMIDRLLQLRDYHSTVLELWRRFGWLGGLGLVGGIAGCWSAGRWWLLAWSASILLTQSTGETPVVVWLLLMAMIGGWHGLDPVPQVSGASRRGASSLQPLPGDSL